MKLAEYECQCDRCKAMCEHAPCHGTPEEMQAIIDAGYSDRLWINDQFDEQMVFIKPITDFVLGPDLHGRCPFFTEKGLCELHTKGLKPLEGRATVHDSKRGFYLREGLAAAWRKPYGQLVLKRFRDAGGKAKYED